MHFFQSFFVFRTVKLLLNLVQFLVNVFENFGGLLLWNSVDTLGFGSFWLFQNFKIFLKFRTFVDDDLIT